MSKKALILGASSDIGIKLASIFAKKKYLTHLHCSNNSKILKKFENKVTKIIKVDFLNLKEKNILNKFDDDYDIIVNLVGFVKNISFEEAKIKNLSQTINVNSLIPLMIIKKSLKKMIKKKSGRIINSSSVGVKFGGGKNTFPYSLSKHINEFIPSEIKKLSKKNIFYNVLRIGLTNTKIHKKIKNKNLKERIQKVPLNKMADPIDIANYIFFICSEKNQFITNEILNITGGE